MILRGIHLEHWSCIGRLDLDDLPLGIVVLYGPNRTGKSSLVKALRGCLFDFTHDSNHSELVQNFPWNGSGPPRVAVEFETGGACYRITKVFSRKSDGLARLERYEPEALATGPDLNPSLTLPARSPKQDGDWQVVENAPKEAARKTRQLLGADKSTAGLGQLLWLDQGQVRLPVPTAIDASLEKRLVGVLGMLVTGRDLAFKQLLDRRADAWFGVTGKHRHKSPVQGLEKLKSQRQQEVEEAEKKFNEVQNVLLALEEGETRQAQLRGEMQQARQERDRLRQEREGARERRQQHREAESEHRRASLHLQEVEDRWELLQAAQKRSQQAEHLFLRAEAGLKAAQEEKERLEGRQQAKARELQEARQAEELHFLGREELDRRRQLLVLARERARLEELLVQVKERAAENAGLEAKLQGAVALDKKTLEALQRNRRESGRLRAQLQAAALTLKVDVRGPAQVRLGLDGQPAQPMSLTPEGEQHWEFQRHARLDIADWGSIELARAREDDDLEKTAKALAELERIYQETVRTYREDPADDDCLDRLAERRLERETWLQSLEHGRGELRRLAPQGAAGLESALEAVERKTRAILERFPDLAQGQPNEEEIEQKYQSFTARADALRKTREQSAAAEAQAAALLHLAQDQLSECRAQQTAARATAKSAREELQRLGGELFLAGERRQAREAVEQAAQQLAQAQLTEAELAVDQRCAAAESAWREREEQWQQLTNEMNRCRGFLQSCEGLHSRRAEAAATLKEAEDALARETREADAHQRLQQLFAECRDSQVQQVMAPIGGRVLGWARDLGLDEYQEVCFGDGYLPEGIIRRDGAPNAPVALEVESYGTLEQLSLLVRLALGGVLAREEPVTAILDDPVAHADAAKHRRMLEILRRAAQGGPAWDPPAGPLQIIVLTCHPERFAELPEARHIDLAERIGAG